MGVTEASLAQKKGGCSPCAARRPSAMAREKLDGLRLAILATDGVEQVDREEVARQYGLGLGPQEL